MSSPYYGDFATGTTVNMVFDTFAAATGAPTATTNFAAADINIYKNLGTTQRSSANGITVTTSFDSITGMQAVAIDLSDNTDAGFYAAGNEYQVMVTPITADGQTMSFWLGAFSIQRSGGALASILAVKSGAGVNVTQFGGSNITSASGIPAVNTTQLNGTAQTGRDIGASVLLSSGTGTGQLKLASGYVAMTWADIAAPTTSVALTGTTIATTQKVDIETIKTNPVVNAGTITFPTTATLASTTNITAGTITTATTATNLTNAPTNGDFTATMKTSIGTAVAASAVASVTGNVGGNVVGSVASVTARVTANTDQWNGVAVGSIPPDVIFIRSGTAQGGAATTITLDASASATNSLYVGENIFIRSGTGAGQSNIITAYVGATKVATVGNTWATNPDNTSVFSVIATGSVSTTVSGTVNANVVQVAGQTASAAAGVTFPSSIASPTNITAGTITTATNLTNAPTAGDFTATMKTSLNAATPAVTVSDKTGFSLSSAGNNSVADALLNRDMSLVTDSNSRSPLNAFRFLRNKWSVATGTLTVTKEDDTTSAWTAVISTDAAALPVTGSDPV